MESDTLDNRLTCWSPATLLDQKSASKRLKPRKKTEASVLSRLFDRFQKKVDKTVFNK